MGIPPALHNVPVSLQQTDKRDPCELTTPQRVQDFANPGATPALLAARSQADGISKGRSRQPIAQHASAATAQLQSTPRTS